MYPHSFLVPVLLVVLLHRVQTSLSPSGGHVCTKLKTTYYTVQESYQHSTGWWLGNHKVTRYRSRQDKTVKTQYFCCPGWKQARSTETGCSLAICHNKTIHTGACNKRGTCTSPERCVCNTGYTGKQCEKCLDERGDPEHSIYTHINSHPDCKLTCSWKNHWCWPGDCPDRRLRTSCTCRGGFRKIDLGTVSTKCDLTKRPELLTCNINMADEHGSTRRSTPGQTTGCQYESDTYVNLKPKSVTFSFTSRLDKTSINMTNPPNFIYQQDVGIVEGHTVTMKQSVSGSTSNLRTDLLYGGSDCSKTLSDTSPSPDLTCSRTFQIASAMKDGERLCLHFFVTAGGFYRYQDFDGNTQGTQIFSHQMTEKQLCFRYDFSKPVHCSKLSGPNKCNIEPLTVSSRITRSNTIRIKTAGWQDLVPNGGNSDSSSGLNFAKIEIMEMVKRGQTLYVNEPPEKTYNGSFTLDVNLNLPNKSGLYAVLLQITDKAKNIQTVRRFVLYDNTSMIKFDPRIPIHITTARSSTTNIWQTNKGPVCLDWKGRYYNDIFKYNNPLLPVSKQPEVELDYDQTSGVLPVTGTTNVDGITEVEYSHSTDKGPQSSWSRVPHFTKQSMCLMPSLVDGQTYTINLKMTDIVKNSLTESVTVHIDSTVPDISHMWLVKDGHKQVYVHDNLNLATMVLQFDVTDAHSGVKTVDWYFGTKDHSQDLGHGNIPVQKLNGTVCPPSSPCYCPSVGECQYSNYTVTLNRLVENNTNAGLHNQEFYFTVVATNEADLKNIHHLDILVDTSPPEPGSVKEGSVDEPDVDYTSEDSVLVSWTGFIDHESGINHYLVAVAPTCLSLAEIKGSTHLNTITVPPTLSEAKFSIPGEGKFFASVVAYNEAMSPSKVVCSDGITRDDSAPVIYNISLTYAQTTTDHVVCHQGSTWLVGENLTMTKIRDSADCNQRCKTYLESSVANILPKSTSMINDTDLSDNLCRELPYFDESSIIFLPSDKIFLSWNSSEKESQMRDFSVGFGSDPSSKMDPDLLDYKSTKGHHFFKLNHAGFAGKNIFFIFVRAANKAGIKTHVHLGPVMIDYTPPIVKETLKPSVDGEFVYVKWNNQTFEDPEQQHRSFTVLFRIVHNGKHVTPILQTPKAVTRPCVIAGYAGCVRYPLKRLQLMDSELNKPFIFELYVYNSAGHFSLGKTREITVVSNFPPGHGIVHDMDPNSQENIKDVDYHTSLNKACVEWSGFYHHTGVRFEVALGTAPNKSDVVDYQAVTSANESCISSQALKPRTKYYTTVKATCPGGNAYASSDGFVIIDQPKDEKVVLTMFDGSGCRSSDKFTLRPISSVKSSTQTFSTTKPLHIGQRYTMQLPNDSYSAESDDVLIVTQEPSSERLTFIPLIYNPTFNLTVSNTSSTAAPLISMCSEDEDYKISRSSVSFHWEYLGPWKPFTTHFEVELEEETKCSNGSHCFVTVGSSQVKASQNYIDLTNVNLHQGKTYHGRVRPCFDTVCLDWIYSDGVTILSGEVPLKISSEWRNSKENGCDPLLIKLDYVDCEESPADRRHIIFQWSAADRHGGLLAPWTTEQGLITGQASVCVDSKYSSYDNLQVCIRASCPSGMSNTVCDDVLKQRKLFPESNVVEIRAKDINDIRKAMTAEHKEINQFDIDYIESGTPIAGAVTTLEHRKSTWYIMTERKTPSGACNSDNKCIMETASTGSLATFTGITFSNNEHYYVCVHSPAFHSSGGSALPAVTQCGDGFITDDDPPTKGKVHILNQKDGYLTEQEHMVITWTGFTDHEANVPDTTISGIANFSYSVGTSPEGQDLLPFTSAGLVHIAHITNIKLQGGETYFVTIKATDHLGHTTTAVSDPVTVDVTPPVQGNIFIGSSVDSHMTVSSESLLVHWDGCDDQESGISSFQISVASKETSEVIPYTECTGSFAKVTLKDRLVDGYKYFVKLQATNRAGLSSVTVSPAFVFDSSPPVHGVVRDGRQTEDDYQILTDNLTCHWTGFHDPHSGLAYFRVGLGTQPYMDDVETMTNAGLQSELIWSDDLELGTKLYCSVEACNQAGLCSRSVSDGIILDNSPPVPGLVFVGSDGHHHKYHGHVSTLTVSWYGFEDPQTGINHFDWCVGSSPKECDVVDATNNLLSDSVIQTGLSLPQGKSLFVTVSATNPAGLISKSTSDSFTLDTSPPTLVHKPSFMPPYTSQQKSMAVQWENSILELSWKFEDAHSPIERHMVSLSTHHDSTAAVENIHLGSQATATILFPKDNLMRSGDIYTATVTACNAAGLCSSASSSDILIDSTPPEMGGIKLPLTWETHNKGGKTTTRLHLRWYGFSDAESGISAYSLSVSRTFDDSELSNGTLTVPHNCTNGDQIADIDLTDHIHTGEDIIITLTAENHAGLPSKIGKVTLVLVASDTSQSHGVLDIQRHSCSIQYCTGECTCAVVGQECQVSKSQNNCSDITTSLDQSLKDSIQVFPGLSSDESVTKSASCLSGYWTVKDKTTLQQIKRFEWSMGQKGFKIGVPIFDFRKEPVWYTVGKKMQVTHCLPNGTALQHGAEYVVYVRVWFSFSQYAIFESHPILTDHTPPSVGRAKAPLESDEKCQKDREFFKAGENVNICWDQVFQESNSAIKTYEFFLGTSPEGNDVLDVVSLGNQTSYKLPPTLLKTGTYYYATIRATNTAGLQTTSVSDGFVIDDVPPVAGVVFNTDRHKNIRVQASNNTVRTSWHGFEDYHSFVERFEVAVLESNQTLQDSMFKYHGLENELVINGLNLEGGKSYRVTVRAVDAAGLKSNVVYSPTLTIDITPPHAFVCTSYAAQNDMRFESRLSKTPGMNTAEIKTSYTMTKGTLYELTVVAQATMFETHVIFTVGKLSVTGRFEKKHERAEASHRFLYDGDGQTNITISITGPNVSDVSNVYIRECKMMSEAHPQNAIRVHQIRPSVVAVCTNIMDPESDVRSIWMGAGTTKGGYQIRALSPTAVSNHEMILVQEPHGSPVYITVMAENQAGLRTIFTSTPITIDHTPPEVVLSTVTINYDKTSNSRVTLDVSWQAKDDESDIGVCYCAAGKHSYSTADASWQQTSKNGHCIISNVTAHHSSQLHASVRCINTVNLETTISSDPLQILHYAPTLQPNSLKTLVDNQISTGHLTVPVQAYNDHVEFFWPGTGSQSVTYECRLVDGGVPLSNWISTGTRTYVRLDGLSLVDGHAYEVQVRAQDERHQYSRALNTSVFVESRSPVKTGKKPVIDQHNGKLTLYWGQVFDVMNMEAVYTISVGTRQGYGDIINQRVTKETNLTISSEQTPSGVFVTIAAKIETGMFGLFSEFLSLSGM